MIFLQANIKIIFTIALSLALIIFFPQVGNTPIIFILLLIYLDISLQSIVFEYQRISLSLARIAKVDDTSFASLTVPEIQFMLSSTPLSTFFFFSLLATGFIIAYLYLNSFIWLMGFLILKYLLLSFIPTYKPYALLFKFMDNEFKRFDPGNLGNLVYKARLKHYYDEMPHSKKYED